MAQHPCKYENPSLDSVGPEKEAMNLGGSYGRCILKELRIGNIYDHNIL